MAEKIARRLPVGAEVIPGKGVHFRVWAPKRRHLSVIFPDRQAEQAEVFLAAEGNGYFSGLINDVEHGALYRYRIDKGAETFPDPASRFQPEGPHGPSCIIDPYRYPWHDKEWGGVSLAGQVLYELHIGTFTVEGTFAAAAKELVHLKDLGVTVVEIMPVAEFPGTFGWGYDGVDIYAPTRLYGEPDDFRRFVDEAHRLGLGVILDVVYNHLGPDGNYLRLFAEEYFTGRYVNEWGDAINFDGPEAGPVRDFFISNVAYWIQEFHLDGFRLDATQQIFDSSPQNILADMTQRAREAAGGKPIIFVAENECQHVNLAEPVDSGGYGIDGLWNDDFHHTAMVAMTGHKEAYYTDYAGRPQEFISALKYGYLYQGQWYSWQKQRRGTPSLRLPPASFILYIQNHDQIANSARGYRCHQLAAPGVFRALTALFLLAPGTPMLFQGQEFAASTPFFYFADHTGELGRLVSRGRKKFLAQFRSLASRKMQAYLPNPKDPSTFHRSKLDIRERETHAETYLLHQDLLRLRREDPVFSAKQPGMMDGAVLGEKSFLLRYFEEEGRDRMLLVNLGIDQQLSPAPEPLLAPPAGMMWEVVWSSEDPRYGGQGIPALTCNEQCWIPGQSAVVVVAQPISGD